MNAVCTKLFSETVVWRTPESLSERTRELLNSLGAHGVLSPAVDILLRVSTEPNHPWNAEFLHSSLMKMELPERDHIWSTHLALSDRSEEDGDSESIVRTLIEWSCFGNLCAVDNERIRLCAKTLIWFLTTPNRRVRDQATKSLARLIHLRPHLLKELLQDFHEVNDRLSG